MTRRRRLDVACASDLRYVPHAAACLSSVLANAKEADVRVHYLHGPRFPRRVATKLRDMVERMGGELALHRISPQQVGGLPVTRRITAPMWFRIHLPELLPDVDRILYLDADTLAVDDIRPLWEIDMSRHHIGAVSNVLETHRFGHPADLGLPAGQRYFNSGVILFNLELMRTSRSSETLLRYAREHARTLLWPDQDALNVVLGTSRLALHPRWNSMNSFRFPWAGDVFTESALEEARRHPGIVHFEGPTENKPWHYLCDRADRDVYFAYRARTPWPRVRITGRTPRNVLARRHGALRAARTRSP